MEEPNTNRNRAMNEILEHIYALVTHDQNELLRRPMELVELEEVVKQMKNDKSLDPMALLPTSFMLAGTSLRKKSWKSLKIP